VLIAAAAAIHCTVSGCENQENAILSDAASGSDRIDMIYGERLEGGSDASLPKGMTKKLFLKIRKYDIVF
jgi:hypothetical protein